MAGQTDKGGRRLKRSMIGIQCGKGGVIFPGVKVLRRISVSEECKALMANDVKNMALNRRREPGDNKLRTNILNKILEKHSS